jgi:hypothetical protein
MQETGARTGRAALVLTALICAAAGTAAAMPPLTTIQDQLFRADGTPVNGTLIISWKAFVASDNSNIPTNSIRVPVSGGTLRVRLTPTTTAQTAARYLVQYLIDGKLNDVNVWAVPPSSTPLTVHGVTVTPPATGSGTGSGSGSGGTVTTQTTVQMTDVVGLTDALAERPTTGADFLVGRVLVPDINGALTGLMGTPDQCVRGDGSLGPCGASLVFVDLETPTGTIDGTNTTFTLSNTPAPSASLLLFRNGLLQKAGVDYTLAGATVTFLVGSAPQPGDSVVASYRVGQ